MRDKGTENKKTREGMLKKNKRQKWRVVQGYEIKEELSSLRKRPDVKVRELYETRVRTKKGKTEESFTECTASCETHRKGFVSRRQQDELQNIQLNTEGRVSSIFLINNVPSHTAVIPLNHHLWPAEGVWWHISLPVSSYYATSCTFLGISLQSVMSSPQPITAGRIWGRDSVKM